MNPYHVATEVQLASGQQGVVIRIRENYVRARASTYGAQLYMKASARFALPALRNKCFKDSNNNTDRNNMYYDDRRISLEDRVCALEDEVGY
jgi:hypothetical protein